jgi:nucleoid DNA-binding protein
MTKQEIAQTIAQATGLTTLQTKVVVQKTMDAILESLLTDRRIELRGFGVFEVVKRAARNGRNPRTGEPVFVPEKLVVTFKSSDEVNERVQGITSSPSETSSDAA